MSLCWQCSRIATEIKDLMKYAEWWEDGGSIWKAQTSMVAWTKASQATQSRSGTRILADTVGIALEIIFCGGVTYPETLSIVPKKLIRVGIGAVLSGVESSGRERRRTAFHANFRVALIDDSLCTDGRLWSVGGKKVGRKTALRPSDSPAGCFEELAISFTLFTRRIRGVTLKSALR